MDEIKLKCVNEAIAGGVKVLEFTKGKNYIGYINEAGHVAVEDDSGKTEYFHDTSKMFKAVK